MYSAAAFPQIGEIWPTTNSPGRQLARSMTSITGSAGLYGRDGFVAPSAGTGQNEHAMPKACETFSKTASEPTIAGRQRERTCTSRAAWSAISGPMPAGSPIVITIVGKASKKTPPRSPMLGRSGEKRRRMICWWCRRTL